MKPRFFLSVLLSGALLFVSGAATAATMYKWKDENGSIHYGEKPPEGVEAKPVSVPSGAAPAGTAPMFPPATPKNQQAEATRQGRADRRSQEQATAEVLDQACKQFQQRLDTLVPRTNILVQGKDGETYRMDDNDRLGQIQAAEQFIEENCK